MHRPLHHRLRAPALGAALAVALAGAAHAATITSGEVVAAGIDDFGFVQGANTLSFDGGATDELYQMYGYLANLDTGGIVRVEDSGTGAGFDVFEGVDAGTVGVSLLDLSAAGASRLGGGLAAGDIRITYAYQLFDDTSPADEDGFAWVIDVANDSAMTLNLAFYAYVDLDLGGTSNDDSAATGTTGFLVSDPNGTSFQWGLAGGVQHYQVGPFNGTAGIRTLLNNMVSANAAQDLADTGLPFGPGDFTGALQKNFSLAAGTTRRINTGVGEPGTALLLALGLLGLGVWGRPRGGGAAHERTPAPRGAR